MKFRSTTIVLGFALSACAAAPTASRAPSLPSTNDLAPKTSPQNELTKKPSEFSFVPVRGLADLSAGNATTLSFTVNRGSSPVKDFLVAHEKLLHFIVVRNDLGDFQHLHPDLNTTTGAFTVPVTFPENGTYALFADFEPKDGEATVLRTDVNVGMPTLPTKLAVDDGSQQADGYTVTPSVESPLPTGADQMFIFGITKNGTPVTDLQNYLGAKGHAVILKEGTLDYFHAHPTDSGGGHGGMVMPGAGEVIFMASLTTPGRYRVFQQYRPEGNLITVANTYDVIAPPTDVSTDSGGDANVPTQEISMEAFQWGYSPEIVRVKLDTRVMIHLTTRDVPHGFNLPEFDVSETILPGKETMADFVADKKGTFSFGCDVACGSGHPTMAKSGGTLIVE